MADNYQKLWLQKAQNKLAINRAAQEIKRQGRALPCRVTNVTGAIVTVEFEMDTSPWTLPPITIPKAESPWVRMPTQIGDTGVTMPADVYLGGVSGLGGGRADFTRRGNLSALVFVPVSNSGSAPVDQNAAQVQGPNGVICQTTEGAISSVVTNQSGTTITFGSNTLVLNESGLTVIVGGVSFVVTGSGITNNGNTQLNGNIGQSGASGAAGTAQFTAPITAPDVILPNGSTNGHVHMVTAVGSNTAKMTG